MALKFEIRITACRSQIEEYDFSYMIFRVFELEHLHRVGIGGQVEIRNKYKITIFK